MAARPDFVELILTCADQQEAEKIGQSLLKKHLVACVKFTPVFSVFRWNGEIEESKEIKISMLSMADNFDRIESEVAPLHSYDTFVLQAVPIARLNKEAADWLAENADG